MDESNTPVEENEVQETKVKEKVKPKAKKSISKATKQAKPKTVSEKKALAKKAAPVKKSKKEKTESKRYVMVGDEKWLRKKVAILSVIQKTPKKRFTKAEIAAGLDKFNMNDLSVNKLCWELKEQGLVDMIEIEGDPNWYRQVTAKGAKFKLPSL